MKYRYLVIIGCFGVFASSVLLCLTSPRLAVGPTDSQIYTLSPGNDYTLMDLCYQQKHFGNKRGQCIAKDSTESNIKLKLVKTDCEDLHIETETVHTTSTFNGYQWVSLQSSLYIINADSAMVNYTITTMPAAEPSTVIEAFVFDDMKEYDKSKLGFDGVRFIKKIKLSQKSNLGIITFPRNKTIYFIALKISQTNIVRKYLVDRQMQRSYYSFSGPTENKTCSGSTECGIRYKKGECVLVKTLSLTELIIQSIPDKALFLTIIHLTIVLIIIFVLCICICTCYSHKKKKRSEQCQISEPDADIDADNSIDNIIQVLVPIVDFNYHHFGHALNLSDNELTTIAKEHGTNTKEFMRQILLKWSHNNNNNNVSWREVVQALEESGQTQLAELISICYIDTTDNLSLASATESIEMTIIDMTPCVALNDRPTMKMLLENVATKMATKWQIFGMMINLPSESLNIIENEKKQEILRMMEVFHIWQRNNDPLFTWNTVIDILRSDPLGEKTLAQNLIDRLQLHVETITCSAVVEHQETEIISALITPC